MFVPPYVDQHRNYHDNLEDFKQETDLYQRSNEFIKVLTASYSKDYDFKQLYLFLYERGILQQNDVLFAKAWMQTFDSV